MQNTRQEVIDADTKVALSVIPANLNKLGFEAALLMNYGLSPSKDRINELFELYIQLKG